MKKLSVAFRIALFLLMLSALFVSASVFAEETDKRLTSYYENQVYRGKLSPQDMNGVSGVMQYCAGVMQGRKVAVEGNAWVIKKDGKEDVLLFRTGKGWISGDKLGMLRLKKDFSLAGRIKGKTVLSLSDVEDNIYIAVNSSELRYLDFDYIHDGVPENMERSLNNLPVTQFGTDDPAKGINCYDGEYRTFAPFRFTGTVYAENADAIALYNSSGSFEGSFSERADVSDKIVCVIAKKPETVKLTLQNNNMKLIIGGGDNDYSLIAYGDSLTHGAGSSGVGHRYIDILQEELGAKSAVAFGYSGSATRAIAFTSGALIGYIPPDTKTFPIKYADMISNVSISLNRLDGKNVIINGKTYAVSQNDSMYTLPDNYVPSGLWLPVVTEESTKTADIYIIWVGTNDGGLQWDLINAMIEKLPHKQYIIMGLIRQGEDTSPEEEQKAENLYGSHFFNTRQQLIHNGMKAAGLEPTEEDNNAVSQGRVPPSLLNDNVHLNDAGYEALGKLLALHISSQRYTYMKEN